MRKILTIFSFLILLSSCSFANLISKHIKRTDFKKNTKVALCVFNKNSAKVIYQKIEAQPLNLASLLKPLTFGVSNMVLGSDYKFETALYEDGENNIYLKLGGDVLFSSNDLNNLIEVAKNDIVISALDAYNYHKIFRDYEFSSFTYWEEDSFASVNQMST